MMILNIAQNTQSPITNNKNNNKKCRMQKNKHNTIPLQVYFQI